MIQDCANNRLFIYVFTDMQDKTVTNTETKTTVKFQSNLASKFNTSTEKKRHQ